MTKCDLCVGDTLKGLVSFSCGHDLCFPCLEIYVKRGNLRCPVCGKPSALLSTNADKPAMSFEAYRGIMTGLILSSMVGAILYLLWYILS